MHRNAVEIGEGLPRNYAGFLPLLASGRRPII